MQRNVTKTNITIHVTNLDELHQIIDNTADDIYYNHLARFDNGDSDGELTTATYNITREMILDDIAENLNGNYTYANDDDYLVGPNQHTTNDLINLYDTDNITERVLCDLVWDADAWTGGARQGEFIASRDTCTDCGMEAF